MALEKPSEEEGTLHMLFPLPGTSLLSLAPHCFTETPPAHSSDPIPPLTSSADPFLTVPETRSDFCPLPIGTCTFFFFHSTQQTITNEVI